MISAKDVNELRAKTGAGMMDCKKALTECNGDMEAATDWLREKGIAKAAKKADRIAAEGLANIFTDGNKAVIMEVNCETDFVTKNAEFVEMIENIGASILASDATTMDEFNNLKVGDQTVSEYIVAKTSKIGEKLSFRRAEVVTKTDAENFGQGRGDYGRRRLFLGCGRRTGTFGVGQPIAGIRPRLYARLP